MRKEVLFAIISGITIGLIIAFGAWKIAKIVNKRPNQQSVQKTPPPKINNSLSVSNLSDFDVITEDKYIITGITSPKTPVVVSTLEEDFYSISDQDGTFNVEVSFPSGLSEIKINDKKYLVVYSSEFKKYLEVKEKQEESEDEKLASSESKIDRSLDEIRENVQKEISNKSLKQTSNVGTITDISSKNIQIKSLSGDIKQISVNEETNIINTLKKNSEVKLNDLAIGDYIIAMGFMNSNKVLDTKRILISSPFESNNFEQEEIEILTISKTKLNDITLPKKWKGPDVSKLEIGQKVIVVGNRDEKKNYSLRSIFTPVE